MDSSGARRGAEVLEHSSVFSRRFLPLLRKTLPLLCLAKQEVGAFEQQQLLLVGILSRALWH